LKTLGLRLKPTAAQVPWQGAEHAVPAVKTQRIEDCPRGEEY
jgi:hypothetical protein